MASVGPSLLLLIAIIADVATSEKSFVTVSCQPEAVVEVGHPALLKCSIQLSPEVSSINIRVLTWKRKGTKVPVLSFIQEREEMKPGYQFADQQWKKNLNVSLLIGAATVEHGGEYICYVKTDSGESTASVNLRVTAKYGQPKVFSIPEKRVDNRDTTLVCESAGGYPQGELRWLDADGKDWTKSSEMEAKQMENGCFNLLSKLVVLRGSNYFQFTCAVFSASGTLEAQEDFNPPSRQTGPDQNVAGIVAPILVIGSLIVGLLLALLVCRRRRAQYPHDGPRQVRPDDVEEGTSEFCRREMRKLAVEESSASLMTPTETQQINDKLPSCDCQKVNE